MRHEPTSGAYLGADLEGLVRLQPHCAMSRAADQLPLPTRRFDSRPLQPPLSAGHDPHLDACLVVQREPVDDVGACPIVADHLDLATIAPEPRDDFVERCNA